MLKIFCIFLTLLLLYTASTSMQKRDSSQAPQAPIKWESLKKVVEVKNLKPIGGLGKDNAKATSREVYQKGMVADLIMKSNVEKPVKNGNFKPHHLNADYEDLDKTFRASKTLSEIVKMDLGRTATKSTKSPRRNTNIPNKDFTKSNERLRSSTSVAIIQRRTTISAQQTTDSSKKLLKRQIFFWHFFKCRWIQLKMFWVVVKAIVPNFGLLKRCVNLLRPRTEKEQIIFPAIIPLVFTLGRILLAVIRPIQILRILSRLFKFVDLIRCAKKVYDAYKELDELSDEYNDKDC